MCARSTTIRFPHGGHTMSIKVAEAERALADGGEELDMVVNISQVLSGDWDFVQADIAAVTAVTHAAGIYLRSSLRTPHRTDAMKIRLCEICSELNCDWVKTSTGYAPTGATTEDLVLMRRHVAPHVQVKAAGGVRTLDRLLEVRGLGVTRCGSTRTAAQLDELKERLAGGPILPKFDAGDSH